MKDILTLQLETIKKWNVLKGRATRKEFWTFVLFNFLVMFALGILTTVSMAIVEAIGYFFGGLACIIAILLIPIYVSLIIRRLHDVNLSGFWFWYLCSIGLPIIFVAYLLDLDSGCERLVDRIQKIGSAWLGWILTFLFWATGAPIVMFMLFLFKGKDEANEFGESPYPKIEKHTEA